MVVVFPARIRSNQSRHAAASIVSSIPSKAAAPVLRNRLVRPLCLGDGLTHLIAPRRVRAGGGNANGDRLALPQAVVRIIGR